MLAPKGYKAAGVACGLKNLVAAKDLALIYSEVPAYVAGLFTRNRVRAAPVLYSRNVVRRGLCRAIIINSGNANACTGQRGLTDAKKTAALTSSALNVPAGQVLVSSTGVIGEFLAMDKLERGVQDVVARLSPHGFSDAAQAIMTTDTCPKMVSEKLRLDQAEVTISGIAKGAGMIRPQLATMLAFICTDAKVGKPVLSSLLREGNQSTFNRITVDGETSTNDMVVLLANGEAGNSSLSPGASDFWRFRESLFGVMGQLARAIIEDGEGRTKVVEICVRGAGKRMQAEKMAFRVAHSPLVKTAIFGEDPNWGRVMAAIGDSGVPFDPDAVSISFEDALVVEHGMKVAGTTEDNLKRVLQQEQFKIVIDLHRGDAEASVLTTDLSYEYVKINASYRT